ncbi:hypothetical protein [Streptomyces sp. ICBB 8177]|uniref:hypothetical protein n=1 Tax=Streptomyces sp. ICBB 8177 TaxID=563922 RepID=UPI000D67A5BB|nr:hypothetical protein [Streptomyces sp. ICBB 8177]PWI45889.1 hypothetical protein CK485_01670 [Streptomyces sp. ICBB 8177]
MALRTRVAAGVATLALSLTGLAAVAAPADAAVPRTADRAHAVTPDLFRMNYFYGTGPTIPLAQQTALLQAQMAGFTPFQCGTVQTTGQPGGYYVTILCESMS